MHQSKLGTEKEQNFKKIQEAVKPRNKEKISKPKKKLNIWIITNFMKQKI